MSNILGNMPPVFGSGYRGVVPAPSAADVSAQNILRADGTWGATPGGAIPSQTGNATKLLTTDGTNASWSGAVTVSGSNATVGGNLTVSGTSALGDATGGVFYQASLNSNNQGTGVRLLNNNAGSRNWYIGSQNNVGNAVEITPSTANNGTTFSTPVWQISSAGNVTQTGNLTVSGTGSVAGNLQIGGAPNTSPSTIDRYSSVNVTNVADFPAFLLSVADGTKNVRGSMYIDASTTQEQWAWDFSYSSASYPQYKWKIAGTTLATLRDNGNLILSSTGTDNANGKLQLADHTTSAGGIGFGTDLSLYRANTGFLILNDASAALDARIGLYNNGTQRGLFEAYNVGTAVYIGAASASWSTIITSGNQATALTLDSSQNATFAGGASIKSTFVYGMGSAATGELLMQRGAGNKIRFATTNFASYIQNGGLSDSRDLDVSCETLGAVNLQAAGTNIAKFDAAKVFIANTSAAPSSNPTAGGFLYVESGALKYRGSSGTVTTIANA